MMKNLLITLVALIVADGLISRFVIRGGLGSEGNPFLATIVRDDRLLLVKLAGGCLAAVILWDVYKRRPKLAAASAVVFVLIYTGIVFWNVIVFVVAQ
jgi:hypothetical protein